MAGFGGGSTYIALLAISGVPLSVVPVLALMCNLVVSSQGSNVLIRRGYADWSHSSPCYSPIPSALFGGLARTRIGFFGDSGCCAFYCGWGDAGATPECRWGPPVSNTTCWRSACCWDRVGLAGITGIGGGIYLAPLMHLLSWARAQSIAACTSLFIALNSLAGLIGQFSKGLSLVESLPPSLLSGCPLAVLLGGRLGSDLLADKLPRARVRSITAVVVLLVAVRLWLKILVA